MLLKDISLFLNIGRNLSKSYSFCCFLILKDHRDKNLSFPHPKNSYGWEGSLIYRLDLYPKSPLLLAKPL